jgi:hypothetical protein
MLLNAHGSTKGKIGVFIEEHFDMTEYPYLINDYLLKVLTFNTSPTCGETRPCNLARTLTMDGLKNIL